MAENQKTRIPRVPRKTAMFDPDGNLTQPWLIFFEQLGQTDLTASTAANQVWQRTLLLKNLAIANDIADQVTAEGDGFFRRILAVLRVAIAEDLEVRINLNGVEAATITIPAATAVDTVLEFTTFANDPQPVADKDVFSFDVMDSDESTDGAGICSVTVEYGEALA